MYNHYSPSVYSTLSYSATVKITPHRLAAQMICKNDFLSVISHLVPCPSVFGRTEHTSSEARLIKSRFSNTPILLGSSWPSYDRRGE
jgi:hypothetical protein